MLFQELSEMDIKLFVHSWHLTTWEQTHCYNRHLVLTKHHLLPSPPQTFRETKFFTKGTETKTLCGITDIAIKSSIQVGKRTSSIRNSSKLVFSPMKGKKGCLFQLSRPVKYPTFFPLWLIYEREIIQSFNSNDTNYAGEHNSQSQLIYILWSCILHNL